MLLKARDIDRTVACLTIEIIERLLAACDWRRLVVWLAIVHRVLSRLYLARITRDTTASSITCLPLSSGRETLASQKVVLHFFGTSTLPQESIDACN